MFITEILRNTFAQVEAFERENPEDARSIARGLEAFKFQISAMIQYIEQPSAMDLEDLTEEVEAEPIMPEGTRH